MARQNINIGTTVNDGTGDPLRTSFDKTNDNFAELYSVSGWAYYRDGETSTQVITTTYARLSINGNHQDTTEAYLPAGFTGSFWNAQTNSITPDNVGDLYNIRIDLTITGKTGSPEYISMILDVGGSSSVTNINVEKTLFTAKTPPYKISKSFEVFINSDFNTNNGQIFLSTDTGTATVSKRSILISRTYKGALTTP